MAFNVNPAMVSDSVNTGSKDGWCSAHASRWRLTSDNINGNSYPMVVHKKKA